MSVHRLRITILWLDFRVVFLEEKLDLMVQVCSSYKVEPQIIEITTAPFLWLFETVHHGDPLVAK